MKAVDILINARALITNPENWCKGTFARNRDFRMVENYSADATKFCASGAIYLISNKTNSDDVELQLAKSFLRESVGICGITTFNDGHEHKDVLEAFDAAIAIAKKRMASLLV